MDNSKTVVQVVEDQNGIHIIMTVIPDQETQDAIASWIADLLTQEKHTLH